MSFIAAVGFRMKKLLLTGIAALFVTSCQAPLRTAHADAAVEMPKALHGEWCWIEGGDGSNWKQQTFVRETPEKPCVGGDNGITIDKNGWGGERSGYPVRHAR